MTKNPVALMLGCLLACGTTTVTQVTVVLDAVPSLRTAATTLRVQVMTEEGASPLFRDLPIVEGFPGDEQVSFPARIPIVPQNGDATRRPVFRGFLLDATNQEISSVERTIEFTEGEFRELNLTFGAVEPPPPPPEMLPPPQRRDLGSLMGPADFGDDALMVDVMQIQGQVGVGWMVFLSAQLSLSLAGNNKLIVDGEQSRVGPLASGFWNAVHWIPADAVRHDVNISVGAISPMEPALRHVHVVAIPFPAAAVQSALGTTPTVDGSDPVVVANLSFVPQSDEYFVIANASLSASSVGGGSLQLALSQGPQSWPDPPLQTGIPLGSQIIARSVTLDVDGSASFNLTVTPTGSLIGESDVAHARIYAFPVDVFAGFSDFIDSEESGNLVLAEVSAEPVMGAQSYFVWRSLALREGTGRLSFVPSTNNDVLDVDLPDGGFRSLAHFDLVEPTMDPFRIEGSGLMAIERAAYVFQLHPSTD